MLTDNGIIRDKKDYWGHLILLAILSLFMVFYFVPPGIMYYGADTTFHIQRLDALILSLKNGTFPYYIDYESVIGYGYATKWFYCDAILVPFAIIGTFTNTLFAYKLLIFVLTYLCGLFTYIAAKQIYKSSFSASIASILYTFCVYRLIDTFERGALGETISFTFVPIVFLGLYEIIRGDYKKWYILTIGYSLIVFTHLLSSILMLGIIILLTIIDYKSLLKEPKRIKFLLISGIFTIPIVAYYIFPMIEQMASNLFFYNVRREGSVEANTLSLQEILIGMIRGLNITNKQIFGTGILLTLGICTRLLIKQKASLLKYTDKLVILGIILTITCLHIFPWGVFPFSKLNILQFPWRIFEYSSFLFSIASGYYISLLVNKKQLKYITILITSILSVVIIINESNIVKNSVTNIKPPSNQAGSHLGNGEYFPAKVTFTSYLNDRKDKVERKNSDTSISNFKKEKGITSFDIEVKEKDTLELPLLYYKGYSAVLNEKEISIKESGYGLIEISPNESGHIKVYYAGTVTQRISFWITILSIITLCIYIYVYNRKRKENA